MKYVYVAQTTELPEGTKKKMIVDGKEIMVANIQDAYFAIDNKCPHMGGSLADGQLDGSKIVCPRHGSIFDVKTGQVVHRGKLLFVNVAVHDLHCYPTKTEGTDLFVGLE